MSHRAPQPERVFFLHIPKTAGTSLIRHLDGHFDPADVWPAQTYAALKDVSPDRLPHCRLIRGHFQHDVARLFPEPPAVVTVIREPVAHLLSHFAHLKAHQDFYPESSRVGSRTLSEALEDPLVRAKLTDVQTRFLGGRPTLARLRELGYSTEWFSRFESIGLPESDELAPDDCLRRAASLLPTFACVGTTDRFGEFLAALSARFGWPRMADDVRANANGDRPRAESLDARTRARINEITALDRELYDLARQVAAAGPGRSRAA